MKSLFNILLVFVLLIGCKVRPLYIQPTNNLPIKGDQESNTQIEKILTPYSHGMASAMNEVIGHSPAFVEKQRPSSALGSFMADATFETAKEKFPNTTICVLNYGGIRSTLDSGDITIGEMFQLMPFENEIVVLKLHISYLDTLRTFIKAKGGEPISNNISDVGYAVANEDQYFYLATNDYMANGGDNYSFLLNAIERLETGIKIRDALIGYVKKHETITYDYKTREI